MFCLKLKAFLWIIADEFGIFFKCLSLNHTLKNKNRLEHNLIEEQLQA